MSATEHETKRDTAIMHNDRHLMIIFIPRFMISYANLITKSRKSIVLLE